MGIFSVVLFFKTAISIMANYFRAVAICAVSDGDVESEEANCCLFVSAGENTAL